MSAVATRPASTRNSKVKLVPITVMIPEDLVRVGQVVAESVSCHSIDHVFACAIHDLAVSSKLAVSVPTSEDLDPYYAPRSKR